MKKILVSLVFFAISLVGYSQDVPVSSLNIEMEKMTSVTKINNQSVIDDLRLLPNNEEGRYGPEQWATLVRPVDFSINSNAISAAGIWFNTRVIRIGDALKFIDGDEEIGDFKFKDLRARRFVVIAEFIDPQTNQKIKKPVELDFDTTDINNLSVKITNFNLGVSTSTFSISKTGIAFPCVIKSDELGISIAVLKGTREVEVLTSLIPQEGIYNFEMIVDVPGGFFPVIPIQAIVEGGKIQFSHNPFDPGVISRENSDHRYSLVRIKNMRNQPITLIIPADFVGSSKRKPLVSSTSSGDSGASSQSMGQETHWHMVNIGVLESQKIYLSRGQLIRAILYCRGKSVVYELRISDDLYQRMGVWWR